MPVKRARSNSPMAGSEPSAASFRNGSTTRQHGSDGERAGRGQRQTSAHHIGDIFGYEELFLRILSFLSPTELASIQGVSHYWSRMSTDQQLWKRLYLGRYPHPHHSRLVYRNAPGANSTPSKLRPIARLPSRAFPPPSPSRSPSASSLAGVSGSSTPVPHREKGKGVAVPLERREVPEEVGYGIRHDGVDWKMMLRLGTNWANGNPSTQSTIPLPPSPSPSVASLDLDDLSRPSHLAQSPTHSEQHIALSPSFIFTSNPSSPLVHVHRSATAESASPLGIIPPPPGWSSPNRPDNVTAICADQAAPLVEDDGNAPKPARPARLAVFYQSGGFVIVSVRLEASRLTWVRESIQLPQSRPRSVRRRATQFTQVDGDPVVLAAMHHPVVIACSAAFNLSVYSLTSAPGREARPIHLSTMQSGVAFHPAALSIFPSDQPAADIAGPSFRASLTYCSPLYPASWTISVQEFGVDLGSPTTNEVWRGECYHVGRGDEADDIDEIWPRRIRPIVGVKGRRAVGVGMDGRWCVLAGEDNQIQVYSLPTPASSPTSKPEPILHAQTLLAHAAAVTSISLNAGRCVSGGRDGRVLVWELDEGEEDGDAAHGSHAAQVGLGGHDGRVGRTVGYVEVKQGGRRRWRGASGPEPSDEAKSVESNSVEAGVREDSFTGWRGLPHPASISSAARSLFLPRPPDVRDDRPPVIRQLAFDEEKIVGLVTERRGEMVDASGRSISGAPPAFPAVGAESLKVWNFNA